MAASREQTTVDTPLGVVTLVTRDDEIYTTTKVFLRVQDSQGIHDEFVATVHDHPGGGGRSLSFPSNGSRDLGYEVLSALSMLEGDDGE